MYAQLTSLINLKIINDFCISKNIIKQYQIIYIIIIYYKY